MNIIYCTTRIPPGQAKSLIFEIVTPDKKKPIQLQTETEKERDEWIQAIQTAIEEQLNQNEPAVTTTENETLVSKILQATDGNQNCSDCGAPSKFYQHTLVFACRLSCGMMYSLLWFCLLDPDWASINLGVLLCLECSGVHRNLGTHITKVRSTILDTKAWEPELVLVRPFHF